MSATTFKNARIVQSGWLEEAGRRLDCNPYMSGALEAREVLRLLPGVKTPLRSLTTGIYHAGREGRLWVHDPEYGTPFLGSSDILSADLSTLPLISRRLVERNPLFSLGEKWTLISRSGTVGRMAYVRPDMARMACSEHVLRVVPDTEQISAGYLYSFLSSKFGVPLIVAGTYGAVIQHIEPEHISGLPVPRFDSKFENSIGAKVEQAAQLLSDYQTMVSDATAMLFESVGLKDITPAEWHSQGPDVGFSIQHPEVASFRALNFNPRLQRLIRKIEGSPSRRLGELCVPGTLARGSRFKRVDASPEHAYRMVGQKELFWLKPEGRWIARTSMDAGSLGVLGAVMVAAQGTLGESEMYCRAEFVWGPWKDLAFSEHILRVITEETLMPRGCMYAFMRSETAFRMLRSISVGSKLQDHHSSFLGRFPVPYPSMDAQKAIHQKVVNAYERRHRAVALMDEAIEGVERRIAESAL